MTHPEHHSEGESKETPKEMARSWITRRLAELATELNSYEAHTVTSVPSQTSMPASIERGSMDAHDWISENATEETEYDWDEHAQDLDDEYFYLATDLEDIEEGNERAIEEFAAKEHQYRAESSTSEA